MREISYIECSCGGEVKEVPQNDKEKEDFNCPKGCCGTALECTKCKVRFSVRFEPPEYIYED